MESINEAEEINRLEQGLLLATEDEPVIYTASFTETEKELIKYQTVRWVIYSLFLVLAWGIGFLMLLYLPVRRYILRKDVRYWLFTRFGMFYSQVIRPVHIPCIGNLEKGKYVLLPSVADIIVEQGYLESLYGVYSVKIENIGVRRPPSDDIKIQVLTRISNMRNEYFARQISTIDDVATPKFGPSSVALMSPSRHTSFAPFGDMAILQKLEEVGSSVKRVQTLMEEQNPRSLESTK